MNITVYLGANEGNDPLLRKAVEELGAWIGSSGNALVYGGSKSGLMGAIADSVLRSGGEVTGVEPHFFIENEFQHEGLTRLIVTEDMTERKKKMIELGDAFIAFPGGTGTLEEIAEVLSKVSLKHLSAPCILYNGGACYDYRTDELLFAFPLADDAPQLLQALRDHCPNERTEVQTLDCHYAYGDDPRRDAALAANGVPPARKE